MSRLVRALRRLRRDDEGATIVEFAFVLPVMLVLIMGLGEILYQEYAQSVLSGALQKAGRDSTIQSADTSAVDAQVMSVVRVLAKSATYTSSRKTYDSFSQVAPEPFTDTDGDGVRDPGECFDDINGNGTWDADPGSTGQGGASDVTLYTMTITYPRLFPMAALLGWSSKGTLSATTLLKNQPYATQSTTTSVSVCT